MKVTINLTPTEAEHILTLLHERKEDGSYCGNKDQYYKRTNKIISKIKGCFFDTYENKME